MTKTVSFPLGRTLATPAALLMIERAGANPQDYLERHQSGDWGDLDADDKAANDYDVDHEGRLLSAYRLPDTTRIYVITEWDRSVTTVLLPEEY